MNSKKPTDTQPSTPTTRATMACGRLNENAATAAVHKANISTHNNKDPSWPPHTAATRYIVGNKELECWATYKTEKSLFTKHAVKAANDSAARPKWANAVGRARLNQLALWRHAPSNGSVACTSATSKAKIKAKCPSSASIAVFHGLTVWAAWPAVALSKACCASGGM